jgi:hypothetical protein
VTDNITDVLEKWRNYFYQLYNVNDVCNENSGFDNNFLRFWQNS